MYRASAAGRDELLPVYEALLGHKSAVFASPDSEKS